MDPPQRPRRRHTSSTGAVHTQVTPSQVVQTSRRQPSLESGPQNNLHRNSSAPQTTATTQNRSTVAQTASNAGGETWMDFIRQTTTPTDMSQAQPSLLTQRASTHHQQHIQQQSQDREHNNTRSTGIASRASHVERKRRLTAPQSPSTRRSGAGPSSLSAAGPSTPPARPLRTRTGHRSLETVPQTGGALAEWNTGNNGGTWQTGSSVADAIDLTASSPPLGGTPARTQRRQSEIMVPRWEPDAEVSNCPVCGTAFNFWYRKHHCRKCGRVVCAGCSPHRVTIPRRFIVRPLHPNDTSAPSSMVDLRRSDVNELNANASLEGGEEVRVCNPCVPDPNLSPPPQQTSAGLMPLPSFEYNYNQPGGPLQSPVDAQTLMQNNMYGFLGASRDTTDGRPNQGTPGPSEQGYDPFAQDGLHSSQWFQNVNVPPGQSFNPVGPRVNPSFPPNFLPFNPAAGGVFGGFPTNPAYYHQSYNIPPRVHSLQRPLPPTPAPPAFDAYPPLPSTASTQAPQRTIPEEDECPVCAQELPPRGPSGSESDRERHIQDCIRDHSFSFSSIPASAPARTSVPPPPPPSDRSRAAHHARGASFAEPPQRRRAATGTRMLVYRASEKDCVGEEGAQLECVICFEEFEEGDEMGRLECLCKFHRACIRKWWDTKGAGSCPTHQLHD